MPQGTNCDDTDHIDVAISIFTLVIDAKGERRRDDDTYIRG